MKKSAVLFLIAASVLAAMSLGAAAQNPPAGAPAGGQEMHHGMPSVDQRVQHLTKALSLSADQQTKVRSILQDQQGQAESVRQDTSLSQQDRHAKFQQIHEASTQKIREVLNDDQKAKFDQMSQHRGHMGKHGSQGDAGSSEKQ